MQYNIIIVVVCLVVVVVIVIGIKTMRFGNAKRRKCPFVRLFIPPVSVRPDLTICGLLLSAQARSVPLELCARIPPFIHVFMVNNKAKYGIVV